MPIRQVTGTGNLEGTATQRATQVAAADLGRRGLDRGVLTSLPLEDLIIGKGMYLTPVDVGVLPYILRGACVTAYDSESGYLHVCMYKVNLSELLPNNQRARRSFDVSVQVGEDPFEYMLVPGADKTLDANVAAWILGVYGSTDTLTIRGNQSYTPPSLAGWFVDASGGAPDILDLETLDWTTAIPSAVLLSQWGTRQRGSAIVP